MSQVSPPNYLFWYSAKCVEVVDGDTITIEIDLGFRIYWRQRVRLYGINTYELNSSDPNLQTLAKEGKQFVIDRILNKSIIVNTYKDRQDKYGRWLATVYYGETEWYSLNKQLVENGLAVDYP